MSEFDFSMNEVIAIISAVAGILLILSVFYIFGTITLVISMTHSIKKRIANGEDFNSGNIFLWYLGWSLAMAFTVGFATIIYFFVKRKEINDTKRKASMMLNSARNVSTQQGQQQYRQY